MNEIILREALEKIGAITSFPNGLGKCDGSLVQLVRLERINRIVVAALGGLSFREK